MEDHKLQTDLFVEIIKYHSEYFKHITTLCTGSILIIVGLIEGVFKSPKGLVFVGFSLIALVACLVASLSMISTLGGMLGECYKAETANIKEITSPAFVSNLVSTWQTSAKTANKLQKISRYLFWIGLGFFLVFFMRDISNYGPKALF